jgi:hypothetical protein
MLNSARKVQDGLLLVCSESGAARESVKEALEVGSVWGHIVFPKL